MEENKMTLTSAIEAAKEAAQNLIDAIYAGKVPQTKEQAIEQLFFNIAPKLKCAERTLAALPEPMTEEEIYKIAYDASNNAGYYEDDVRCVIRALRDHNVLFVKE